MTAKIIFCLAVTFTVISLIKAKCGENETYNECGTSCPDICGERQSSPCILICNPGCFCNEGYIRSEKNGTCITQRECDLRDKCGKNEEYRECGSACPPVCGKPQPEVCIALCVEGCFCKRGYIRKDNRCIPIEECKQ